MFALTSMTVNAEATTNKPICIQEIHYDHITNPAEILQLAENSCINVLNTEELQDSLEVEQLISEKTYTDGTVVKEYALSQIQLLSVDDVAYEKKTDSWGKYDIACVFTIYYEHYSNEPPTPEHASFGVVMTHTTFSFVDLGSNPIYLSTVQMYYHGFHSIEEEVINTYATYNNPSPGIEYTLQTTDSRWYNADDIQIANAGAIVTLSDGFVSGDYDLMIELPTLLN